MMLGDATQQGSYPIARTATGSGIHPRCALREDRGYTGQSRPLQAAILGGTVGEGGNCA